MPLKALLRRMHASEPLHSRLRNAFQSPLHGAALCTSSTAFFKQACSTCLFVTPIPSLLKSQSRVNFNIYNLMSTFAVVFVDVLSSGCAPASFSLFLFPQIMLQLSLLANSNLCLRAVHSLIGIPMFTPVCAWIAPPPIFRLP